jgi:hypothetical protein
MKRNQELGDQIVIVQQGEIAFVLKSSIQYHALFDLPG